MTSRAYYFLLSIDKDGINMAAHIFGKFRLEAKLKYVLNVLQLGTRHRLLNSQMSRELCHRLLNSQMSRELCHRLLNSQMSRELQKYPHPFYFFFFFFEKNCECYNENICTFCPSLTDDILQQLSYFTALLWSDIPLARSRRRQLLRPPISVRCHCCCWSIASGIVAVLLVLP